MTANRTIPSLELTYFDFHGGRGEPARLALSIGGVPFADRRVKFEDWPALKPTTPFGGIPVLKVDGAEVAQSNGINRFVGKLTGLYPEDPLQAAFCDEAMDAVEEISVQIVSTFLMTDAEEKKARRQALADGPIRFYLERLEKRLEARGGQWFADGRLTVADLKVFVWVRHLKSGTLDHVPTDLPDRFAPRLLEHLQRVRAQPKVRSYYAERGAT
jgi:prostaglandin-H2 D-isomerase / glutathione transferase